MNWDQSGLVYFNLYDYVMYLGVLKLHPLLLMHNSIFCCMCNVSGGAETMLLMHNSIFCSACINVHRSHQSHSDTLILPARVTVHSAAISSPALRAQCAVLGSVPTLGLDIARFINKFQVCVIHVSKICTLHAMYSIIMHQQTIFWPHLRVSLL